MKTSVSQIQTMLLGKAEPSRLVAWLRNEYLVEIVKRLNRRDSRRLIALYGQDKIPDNERNLTDSRNRVSLIIEYELARLSNDLLTEHGVRDPFWTYVVANRFPDLEVRCADGTRGLRFEVKCLQSIAEEKSANFDTLKKDIYKGTDFIVVFLWEWASDAADIAWVQAVKILDCFVFDAYSLAELRDHYWLNCPPADLAGGYQGFDLRFAVNCRDGEYNEEEGNYGKLLRIWQKDFRHRLVETPERTDTERAYLAFRERVGLVGFESLCSKHLPKLSKKSSITAIPDGAGSAYRAGEFGMFFKAHVSQRKILELMASHGLKFAVVMTERYRCQGLTLRSGKAVTLFDSLKPKNLGRAQFHLGAD